MKVGDYVRTEDGIKKVLKYTYNEKYENCHCVWFDTNVYGILFTDEEVNKMKPSPNIIDLIKVGDYVNGYLVKDIDYAFDDVVMNNKNARIVPYIDCNKNNYIDDIKSIVTKEQFERMEYKVC